MTLEAPTKHALLEGAATRVAADETFMASALSDWTGGRFDLDAVMTFLECTREAAVRLALCRRPSAAAQTFRAEVSKIAAHVEVDEARLLGLLREVASLAAFRKSDGSQLLAAARDSRSEDKDEEP